MRSSKRSITATLLAALLVLPPHLAGSLSLPPAQTNRANPVQQSNTFLASRFDFLASSAAAVLSTCLLSSSSPSPALAEESSVTAFQLPSGLQYVELLPGTSNISPDYGQLVSITYTSYIQLPNQKKQQFDSSKGFLFKHGSGRCIAGLDEGIHTMKVGGLRRLLIPPKLGYVDSGLGPMPIGWLARMKLNGLLDKMVEVKAGTLIMDVQLVSVLEDEADQGYYSDSSLSPEDFETLKNNLQSKSGRINVE